MASPPEIKEDLYPIRTVSSLTGVNSVTLRAWERRYGLITPKRTETGHRLYTKQNIEMINRAIELQEEGIPISQAAEVLKQRAAAEDPGGPATDETWHRYQQGMLDAIGVFSEARLDLIYEEVLASHTIPVVIRKLIIPILEEVGRRWVDASGSVAEEHFFSVYMRNKLGALFHHRTRLSQGHRLLCACMPGEMHEIGLLLFALSAHGAGFRPVLLGTNMPLTGLALTAQRAGCGGIVLAARRRPSPQVLENELPRLVKSSPLPIFIGGVASMLLSDTLAKTGAIPIGKNIDHGIRRMKEHFGADSKAGA